MNQDSSDVYGERLASGQLPRTSTLRPYPICWLCLVLIAAPRLSAQLSAKDVLTGSRFPLFARFSVSPDSTLVAYTAERTRLTSSIGTNLLTTQLYLCGIVRPRKRRYSWRVNSALLS